MAKLIPVLHFVVSAYFATQQERSNGQHLSDVDCQPSSASSERNLAQELLDAATSGPSVHAYWSNVERLAEELKWLSHQSEAHTRDDRKPCGAGVARRKNHRKPPEVNHVTLDQAVKELQSLERSDEDICRERVFDKVERSIVAFPARGWTIRFELAAKFLKQAPATERAWRIAKIVREGEAAR